MGWIVATMNEVRLKAGIEKFNSQSLLSEIYLNKSVQKSFYDITKCVNASVGLNGFTINNVVFAELNPNHWVWGSDSQFVQQGWDGASGFGAPRHKTLQSLIEGTQNILKHKCKDQNHHDHKPSKKTVSSFINTLDANPNPYIEFSLIIPSNNDLNCQGLVLTSNNTQAYFANFFDDVNNDPGQGTTVVYRVEWSVVRQYRDEQRLRRNWCKSRRFYQCFSIIARRLNGTGNLPFVGGQPSAGSLRFFLTETQYGYDPTTLFPQFQNTGKQLLQIQDALIQGPYGIAVDAENPECIILYVSNTLNGTIVKVDVHIEYDSKLVVLTV